MNDKWSEMNNSGLERWLSTHNQKYKKWEILGICGMDLNPVAVYRVYEKDHSACTNYTALPFKGPKSCRVLTLQVCKKVQASFSLFLKKDTFIFILCVWLFSYMHVCAPGACRSQKETVRSLELESPTVVCHHVGTRNWTCILCKSSKYC